MVNIKKILMTFGTLVSLALLIHGCGGGGGGSSTPTAGTASKSAAASSKAIVSALGAASLGTNPTGKPSLKAANVSDEAQVRQALKGFKASLSARKQKGLQAATPATCDTGTGSFDSNDQGTADPSDDTFTETFDNCTISLGGDTADPSDDFTFFQNGSLSFAPTTGGFAITFTNFTVRTTSPSGKTESTEDGTMSFSGEDVPCGTEGASFLESGSFTMNFTSTIKMDLDNDGTFEFDEASAMDNLTMTTAEEHTAAPDCTLTKTIFTMNGGTSITDNVNSENSFSATFTDFTMEMTPATVNGVDGDKLSLSGTIAISSSCASGTFTISTPAGEEPFIPADGSCPVSGKFLITSGSTTTAVTFTPTGGIEIDEGNNGSVEQSFTDCESAEVCSTSA